MSTLIPALLLALLTASPALAAAEETVDVGEGCKITVPQGAKSKPQKAWYKKFKEAFGENSAQSARDGSGWRPKNRRQFDTCGAFKVMIGICWKEGRLDPNIGLGDLHLAHRGIPPASGMCQIQVRNCAGVGMGRNPNLNDPLKAVECAAKIMRMNITRHGCVTAGANQAKNGKCLTNWSTMICKSTNPKVGHREVIRQYVAGTPSCN